MIAWRIALRYLFSKKSHSAVNIISIVAVAGVAVATAAIVIVLSVFNGFTQLASKQLSAIDPDLKIVPSTGKDITSADSLCDELANVEGVEMAATVVEERGLAISGNMQMPVIFKGVPADYERMVDLPSLIIDGDYQQEFYDMDAMQVTPGVAVRLGIRPSTGNFVSLYVPRRVGRINPANPTAAFRGQELMLTGVIQSENVEYDADYVIVPISVARDLLQYDDEATAIEVKLADGHKVATVMKAVREHLPQGQFKVLTRQMQEERSFRMIQIEKWVTFLMLAFILLIASFNIISTLSLLVIEKRQNMATLRALGAQRGVINRVFMCEGVMVSVAGGIIGIILGAALTLAQQYGHFIKLAGDPSQLTIDTYPARLECIDLLIVFALVMGMALLTSLSTLLFTSKEKIQRI